MNPAEEECEERAKAGECVRGMSGGRRLERAGKKRSN